MACGLVRGKAVEQKTSKALSARQPVDHDLLHEFVGYEFAGVHEFGGGEANWRLTVAGGSQQFACGEVRDVQGVGKANGLRAFASAGRA